MEPLKALWTYMTTSSSLMPQPRRSLQFLRSRVLNINHRLAAIELQSFDPYDEESPTLYPYVEPPHREKRLYMGKPLKRRRNLERINRRHHRRFL